MQAAMSEAISGERKASSLLPMDTLAATIRARVAKGDKATSDADGHYLAAGLLLLEAKRRLPLEQPGMKWPAYPAGTCKIGTTRADELIAIAEERTTLEAQREKSRNRQRDFAAKNKAARSNVSNGQSPHKTFIDRIAKLTVTADPIDLEVIEQFVTSRMNQRTSAALKLGKETSHRLGGDWESVPIFLNEKWGQPHFDNADSSRPTLESKPR